MYFNIPILPDFNIPILPILPDSVKQSLSVDSFKSCLKTYLFTLSDSEVASLF